MSARATVIGGRGFVGAALASALRARGDDVAVRSWDAPARGDCGHVFYVSGVAWGARCRPLDSYAVHVEGVRRALEAGAWESFTYVSSTRVYERAAATDEAAALPVEPADPGDVYAVSKIAGENLCLASGDSRVRVVRLSNVFGPSLRSELFLSQLLRAAARSGVVRVRSSRASSKDYVAVEEVAALLPQIAASGKERIYNVAAGVNTTHGAILDAIRAVSGARIEIEPGAPTTTAALVSVARLGAEFDVPALRVERAIPVLYRAFAEAERTGAVV